MAKAMKILVDALSARRGGGQTYVYNLIKNSWKVNSVEIFLLAQKDFEVPGSSNVVPVPVNSLFIQNPVVRNIWLNLELPRIIKKYDIDILFSTGGLLPDVRLGRCKQVTMFRNMLPFDSEQVDKHKKVTSRLRYKILKAQLRKSMIKADLVIFISHFAKEFIDKETNNTIKDSVVIYHGLSDQFKLPGNNQSSCIKQYCDSEYLLYVSTFSPYKNQLNVVKSFRKVREKYRAGIKLLLIGYKDNEYGHLVQQEVRRMGLVDDVIMPGTIRHDRLPGLYANARINIFASECENCPNILLECLGSGRPVLVSDHPPMPEFAADTALYFDAASPADLADKILSVLQSSNMEVQLAEKAVKRSAVFDWELTTFRTFESLMSLK